MEHQWKHGDEAVNKGLIEIIKKWKEKTYQKNGIKALGASANGWVPQPLT